jgi:hypothetical protein
MTTTTPDTNAVELVDLSTRDLSVILDVSGSMHTSMTHPTSNQPTTRWEFIKEWAQGIIAQACQVDQDGIDLYTVGGDCLRGTGINTTTAMSFLNGIVPRGGTPMGQVLNTTLSNYINRRTANDANGTPTKPVSFIILFDGEPDNKVEVENAIINLTKTMDERGWDDSDVGLSFLQVDNDAAATSWLSTLDNGLETKGARLDITDCKTFSEWSTLTIQQIVTDGIKD